MATVNVEKNSYKVETLYQWDKDQKLEIYGLSLASIPEVHFANVAMGRAIVRQATVDAAGVVRVDIPNSLLQKASSIQVYVCTYAGSTFETQYKLDLPVKPRQQPADYTLEDDPEVYSFNALENQVLNALSRMDKETTEAKAALNAATAAQTAAETAYKNAKSDVDEAVDSAVDEAMAAIAPLLLSDATAAMFGLSASAVPDDVFAWLGEYTRHWWRRRGEWTVWTTESADVTSDLILSAVASSSGTYNIQIADAITQDAETGELSLVDPQTYSIQYSNDNSDLTSTVQPAISGKYIKGCFGNEDNIYLVAKLSGNGNLGDVYSNASTSNSVRYQVRIKSSSDDVKATLITPTSYIENSAEWEYISNADENAYPESGTLDGAEYEYLGIPFHNAVTAPKIATGSYVGAGVYGNNNPHNELTFDFVPKLLVVSPSTNTSSSSTAHYMPALVVPYGTVENYYSVANSVNSAYFTWSGNSVSWYSTGLAKYQYNDSNVTYKYFAIG